MIGNEKKRRMRQFPAHLNFHSRSFRRRSRPARENLLSPAQLVRGEERADEPNCVKPKGRRQPASEAKKSTGVFFDHFGKIKTASNKNGLRKMYFPRIFIPSRRAPFDF
jgi:hypothetical protein